eukprot:1435-Heterococcus_DN1.PRE.1
MLSAEHRQLCGHVAVYCSAAGIGAEQNSLVSYRVIQHPMQLLYSTLLSEADGSTRTTTASLSLAAAVACVWYSKMACHCMYVHIPAGA